MSDIEKIMQHTTGQYFASCGDDIKIWEPNSLQVVKQYNFHKGTVKDLCWSRENTILCSTSSSGDKILLCDSQLHTNEKPKIKAEHAVQEHQTCVRISTSGKKLYSGGIDGTVSVWDRDTGKLKKIFKDTHSKPVSCLALNSSETHLASGSSSGDVVIRNLGSDVIIRPDINPGKPVVRCMAFSQWKHSLFGIATDDGSVNLWNVLQGSSYHNFPEIHNAPAMGIVFSPLNDMVMASVGLDKHLNLYDVKQRKFLNKVKAEQPLTSLAFLHDGCSIFAGSSLGRIYNFDLRYFNRAVHDVMAHASTVQCMAMQNLIKVKKDRTKLGVSEAGDRGNAKDEVTKFPTQKPSVIGLHGKGDVGAISSSASPSLSSGATRSSSSIDTAYQSQNNTVIANGHGKKRYEPVENSTPTYKTSQDPLPSHVDDLGGVISPLREEVFGIHSNGDFSALPDDMMTISNTFSSVGTMGSYYDDILSPIGSNNPPNKGRTPVGTQMHTNTSPHPLRQTTNAVTEKDESQVKVAESSSAQRQRAHASSSKSNLDAANENKRRSKQNDRQSSFLLPRNSNVVPQPRTSEQTNKLAVTSHAQASSSVTRENVSSTSSAPNTSNSRQVVSTTTDRVMDSTAFQYQAEYLQNIVKETFDELSDNLRGQINDMMHFMVKQSLQQEEFNRRLLTERQCGVNEQLLKECERLREENERLKKFF